MIIVLMIFGVIITFLLYVTGVIKPEKFEKIETRTGGKKKLLLLDIDNTLTDINPSESTRLLNAAIDNGYELGVITASDRPIEMLCNGRVGNEIRSPFMPDILCERIYNNNYKTFNTYSITLGNPDYPRSEFVYSTNPYKYGLRKGKQAQQSKDDMKFDQVIILDDQKIVCDSINKTTDDNILAIQINNKNLRDSVSISNPSLKKIFGEYIERD